MPRKVLVWVLRPDGRALLLRRARSDSVPGWHPVTGNVEDREDLTAAAAREVLEETGLRVEVVSLSLSTSFERYGTVREEFAFAARADATPVLSSEHDRFEWVEIDEALRRVGFEFQRTALKAAAERLVGG